MVRDVPTIEYNGVQATAPLLVRYLIEDGMDPVDALEEARDQFLREREPETVRDAKDISTEVDLDTTPDEYL